MRWRSRQATETKVGHETSITDGAAATGRRLARHGAWLPALLAALVLASCGGSGGSDAAAVATTTEPAQVDVGISAPANGDEVKASETAGARMIATVDVEGTAKPGAELVLQSSCQEAECRKQVTVGADGSFDSKVPIWSTEGANSGYVIAGAQGSAPADRARVLVLLKRPKSASLPQASTSLPGKQSKTKRSHSEPGASLPTESEPATDAAAEGDPLPAAPETLPVPAPIPAPKGGGTGTLVMIGDSLAEGTEPYLGGLLNGWDVTTDARVGRPLAEGMSILGRTKLPGGPVVLAFSLFTNDSPRNVPALDAAVRASVKRAGSGCAIWATIVRPPQGGVSYKAANQDLRRLERDPSIGGRLLVVPWAETVAANPRLVGSDGVHATQVGYQTRASLYAQAVSACGG